MITVLDRIEDKSSDNIIRNRNLYFEGEIYFFNLFILN